ncbi:hypothetical protein ACLX1H_010853 [Fusarium chlamydosporum]
MVNPETPLDFDATKFRHGFDGDYDPYLGQPFRFEFFFLPDATSEECIAHYRKEMASRGTVWHQIRQVRAATKDRRVARRVTYRRERAAMKEEQTRRREAAEDPASKTSHDEFEEFTDYSSEGYNSSDRSLFHEDDTKPHPTGPNEQKLPGLPWLKDDELNGYRQWFLMCTDEQVKWDHAGPGYNKQALNLRVVEFDPVPIEYEEGEVVRWDPMDHPVRIRQGPDLRFTCWQRERCREYWAMQAMEAMAAEDIGWETC